MRLARSEDASRDVLATHWHVRLHSGSISSDERQALENWLAADDANRLALEEAEQLWELCGRLAIEPAIEKRRTEALAHLHRSGTWRLPSGWRGVATIAASLLVSMSLVPLSHLLRAQSYATQTGERREVRLDDGSKLSLDADTVVAVDYGGDHRSLTLTRGRAKFTVAKDRTRPFVVVAVGRSVVATGTVFSVEIKGGALHVIVYEGHVAVLGKDTNLPPARLAALVGRSGKHVLSIAPGQELVIDPVTIATSLIAVDTARSRSWEGGELNFVDEPLGDAVAEFNRYDTHRIVVADPRTSAMLINGVFDANDSEAFIEAIGRAYAVRAYRSADGTVLTARTHQ